MTGDPTEGATIRSGPRTSAPASVAPDDFRRALGCFVTGVTVVTACERDGTARGITANSFTSVSLEPPLVLVCIGHGADSHGVFRECGHFAVSILSQSQQPTAALFATKSPTKFQEVGWRAGLGGAPILDEAVAWVECVPHERVDAGDHLVLIGRVVGIGHTAGAPLGYCRGNYITFDLEQQAVMRRPGQRVRVGCILDHRGTVLLLRDEDGRGWTLPLARSGPGEGGDVASLRGALEALGVRASLGFLFAVFELPRADELYIFYRGEIEHAGALDPDAARLVPYAEIPWDALPSDAFRSMLGRYVAERRELDFGVYVGDERAGSVTLLPGSE